jgi:ABC-type glycerol-3-phosphate transport system substrate-binding protein
MWEAYNNDQLVTTFYPNWQDFLILDFAPETKGKWRVTRLPAVQSGGKRAHADDGVCLTIPSALPDDEKELAIEVALYMKLTEKATVAHMETFNGAFVSYVPGLEAVSDKPSQVLDEQFVYRLFLDAAREEEILPWYRTSVFFPDAAEAVSDAMFEILKRNAPIEQRLKEAADSIRRLQERKGTK